MSDTPQEREKYSINTEKLPFAKEKQQALLGHALKNENFFSKTIRTIESDWFHDPILGRIWKNIKDHWKTYKAKPSVNEIKECPDFVVMTQNERTKHTGMIDVSIISSSTISVDVLLNEMNVWFRARVLQIGVPQVADLYNRHKVTEAAQKLKEVIKDFNGATSLEDKEEKFGNVEEELKQVAKARENACTIGNRYFDHIIDEKCQIEGGKNSGSLHRGEMSVVLAPTSAGKTTMLATTIVANIKRGKKILYVTHEDPKISIKMNLRKAMISKTDGELMAMFGSPEGLQYLKNVDALISQHVTYLPMNKVGLSVEEVMDTMLQFNERHVMEFGKGYDLAVDDYPSRLRLAYGAKWEKRQVLEEIYQQFAQFGLDIDAHMMCAMQVNREGNKVNKRMGNYEKTNRLVTLEDASEAFGPMTAARVVITINRTPFDKQNKQTTFLCCKTKQGEADMAITLDSDYARALAYKENSRCFWYRGDVSLAKFSEEILRNHGQGEPQQVEDQRVIRYLNLIERGDDAL